MPEFQYPNMPIWGESQFVLIQEHILNNINIILEIHIYIDYSKSYNLSHKKEIDMLREELDKRRDSTYKSHFKSTIQKN